MNDRRPMQIGQPGMTAWGRAAERELETYAQGTALRVPDDLADRVMAAIVADASTRRVSLPPITSRTLLGRLRLAGGLAALVLTLTVGGALAVAGASTLLLHVDAPPVADEPDGQPVIVAEPTPTPARDVQDPASPPPQRDQPPTAPGPDEHKAVEAADPGAGNGDAAHPHATDDADRDDQPEGTDDDGHGGGDTEETDDPGDGSSGGSDGSSGGSDGSSSETDGGEGGD